MGNWWSAAVYPLPPPPMVLVPPLFDFPPLAARTRMLESSYLLFGTLALRCLFEDYFEEAKHFNARIMLKPIDDPHVDLIASVAGPVDHKPEKNIVWNAQFRWQRSEWPFYYTQFSFIAANPLYHERTKHIEIDYHLVREMIRDKLIETSHILSYQQPADLFTKALSKGQHRYLLCKLGMLDLVQA